MYYLFTYYLLITRMREEIYIDMLENINMLEIYIIHLYF